MTAPRSQDRVSFQIRKDYVALFLGGGAILTAAGVPFIAAGDTLPGVAFLFLGIVTLVLAAPKLRPGPILVVDRAGLEAVRLSLRLRWEEIERMRLTKQATSAYGNSVTYLDVWPADPNAAHAQIRRRFGPFAGVFGFGGGGAIRVTIFLWNAHPVTVAAEVERLSGRAVER